VLHPPAWAGHDLPWVLFGLVLALTIAAATTAARPYASARRIGLGLRAASHPARGLDARVVPSDVPLSVTAGLWRPTIFLSSGLLNALRHPVLDVVVAHERGHVARRDTLRSLIVAALSRVHLPWTRRCLLEDLALAHEEACDDVTTPADQNPSLSISKEADVASYDSVGDVISYTITAGSNIENIDLPASEQAPGNSIQAKTFDANGTAGAGLTSATFVDDVQFREDVPKGTPRMARSRTLDLSLEQDEVSAATFKGSAQTRAAMEIRIAASTGPTVKRDEIRTR